MRKIYLIFLIFFLSVSASYASINAGISFEHFQKGEIKLLPKVEDKLPQISSDRADETYWVKYRPVNLLSQKDIYKINNPNLTPLNQNMSILYDSDFNSELDANAYWDNVLIQNPNRAEYFYAYANYLKNVEKFQEAIEKLDKTLSIDPDFALAHFLKGDIYRALGQYRNSVREYVATININPYCTDAYFNIAQTLEDFKQFELALDFYGYAYLTNPNDIEIRNTILKLRKELAYGR